MKQMVERSAAMGVMFTEGKRLAAIYGAENVYDFGMGNPNVKAPASVNDTAVEILRKMDSLQLHSYTDSSGMPAARKAIAESLNRRFGTNYDESNPVMTVGAACDFESAFGCKGYVRISYCAARKTIKNSLTSFQELAESYKK